MIYNIPNENMVQHLFHGLAGHTGHAAGGDMYEISDRSPEYQGV